MRKKRTIRKQRKIINNQIENLIAEAEKIQNVDPIKALDMLDHAELLGGARGVSFLVLRGNILQIGNLIAEAKKIQNVDPIKALAMLDQAESLGAKNNVSFLLLKGHILLNLNMLDKTQEVVKQINGFNQEGASHFLRARIFLAKGSRGKAKKAANAAIKINQEQHKSADDKPFIFLAKILRKESNLPEAEKNARAAVKVLPSDENRGLLASILKESGKLEEAKEIAEMLIKNNDGNSFRLLASILKKIGELEEAEKMAKKAIGINGNTPKNLGFLANILMLEGKLEEAESLLCGQQKLGTINAGILAKILMLQEKWEEAEKLVSCMKGANDVVVLVLRAKIFFHKGNLLEAEKMIRRANNLKGGIGTNILLVKILMAKSELKEAEEIARKILGQNSNFESCLLLYKVLMAAGKREEAEKMILQEVQKDSNKDKEPFLKLLVSMIREQKEYVNIADILEKFQKDFVGNQFWYLILSHILSIFSSF